MSPNQTIIEHYADYYGSPELAQWRELGARDKSSNIETAWLAIQANARPTIADIGCGDGAVIQALLSSGFGASATGYEVSPSGVACANERTYNGAVQFEVFDGQIIPASDKSFDLEPVINFIPLK
jgi:methylase of polypeptide subunit release factors